MKIQIHGIWGAIYLCYHCHFVGVVDRTTIILVGFQFLAGSSIAGIAQQGEHWIYRFEGYLSDGCSLHAYLRSGLYLVINIIRVLRDLTCTLWLLALMSTFNSHRILEQLCTFNIHATKEKGKGIGYVACEV